MDILQYELQYFFYCDSCSWFHKAKMLAYSMYYYRTDPKYVMYTSGFSLVFPVYVYCKSYPSQKPLPGMYSAVIMLLSRPCFHCHSAPPLDLPPMVTMLLFLYVLYYPLLLKLSSPVCVPCRQNTPFCPEAHTSHASFHSWC